MNFSELKLFQVKPDRLQEFEELAKQAAIEQKKQPGCKSLKYFKRFYTLDMPGPPRELTKIVKCVKYFSYWEFTDREKYGDANNWFFEFYSKQFMKLLIMPFDINLGYNLD
ncbi:MAG: antibiotic biosynthesis monooxygenase [Treponema sp.]|nr:antibiotic biosynthesis monooxygenase [Treponema sp.]